MTCSSSTISRTERSALPRGGRMAALLAACLLPLLALAFVTVSLLARPETGHASARSAAALIDAARRALRTGDGIAAEMKLRAALEAGASRSEVAAFMGEAYLDQGDLAQARGWLEAGDFAPGTAAEGWRQLAWLERLDGHLAAAGRAYDKVLAITPNDAGLWVEIGRLRYAGGQHVLALAAGRKALAIDPKNVRALQFGGELVRDRYGLSAAIPWFERALQINARDVPVLLDYAATLGDLGRASEALVVTRRVLQLEPNNPRAYYLQAVIAARAGNYALSRILLDHAGTKLDGEAGVMMLHAVTQFAAGNYQMGADWLEQCLKIRPDDRNAKNLLARDLYFGGRYRYLTQRLSADIAKDDAAPYLLTVAARAYEALGERDVAGVLLDRAAQPRRPGLRVLPSGTRIGALLAQGQGAEAEQASNRELHVDPGSYGSLSLAGDAQLAALHPAQAQTLYALASQIRMPQGLFLRRLAAYSAANDRQGARDLVTAYLHGYPRSHAALRAAAQLAEYTGDFARARAILVWLRDNGGGRDVQLLSTLAVLEARLGDDGAALTDAAAAYRLQRASPIAAQALGFAYASSGSQPAAAQALLDKAQAMTGLTPLILRARTLLADSAP